jgi:hypothetical protein
MGGVVQPTEHETCPETTNSGIDGNTEKSIVEIAPAACDLIVIAHR